MKSSILQNEKYGRLVLIGLSILLWLVIMILMRTIGYEETWRLWKVPTEWPIFEDFRLIPGSAESYLRGYEPSVENPYDPGQRIFNYPTFWRMFFYSGVTQDDTVWISVSMIVLFFVAVFLFPGKLRVADALAMLFFIFSPASMLLYERGNVDLIVFFVCVISLVLTTYSPYIAAAGLLFGAVMKMFPFFGLSILLKETRSKFLWLIGICTVLFGIYFLITLESAAVAWNRTMRGTEISYGANVVFDRYYYPSFDGLSQWISDPEPLLKYGPIAMAALLMVSAGIVGLAKPQTLSSSSERNLAAFRMGASIYLGTFLLGNNWDYRLAFLVLIVPQLAEWMRSSEGKIQSVLQLCILTLVLTFWHFLAWFSPLIESNVVLYESTFVLDEFVNWTLMVTLTYLFVMSLPDWVKADFKRFLPKRNLTPSPSV